MVAKYLGGKGRTETPEGKRRIRKRKDAPLQDEGMQVRTGMSGCDRGHRQEGQGYARMTDTLRVVYARGMT